MEFDVIDDSGHKVLASPEAFSRSASIIRSFVAAKRNRYRSPKAPGATRSSISASVEAMSTGYDEALEEIVRNTVPFRP